MFHFNRGSLNVGFESEVGTRSFVFGTRSQALGGSFSLGSNNISNGDNTFTVGWYNLLGKPDVTSGSGRTFFSVGMGAGNQIRSDDDLIFFAVALGKSNQIGSGPFQSVDPDFINPPGQVAIGNNNRLADDGFAFGDNNQVASYSMALGENNRTSGRGFALGRNTDTLSYNRAMIFNTNNSVLSPDNDEQFVARAVGGFKLYTNVNNTAGISLAPNASSWAFVSDRDKKENWQAVDGEALLQKIAGFDLGTWNYIGQDPSKFRHYGPMAQDFHLAFGFDGIGTIGEATTIATADFLGVNFTAIQALEARTAELQTRLEGLATKDRQIQRLQTKVKHQRQEIDELKARLARLEAVLLKQP